MKRTITILSLFLVSLLLSTSAYAVCVKVKKANLRTGPGTSYEKAWEIYKYMPFLKVGTSVSGDWYAVKDVDGAIVPNAGVSLRNHSGIIETSITNTLGSVMFTEVGNVPAKVIEEFRKTH